MRDRAEESALIERCRRGDEAAWAELYAAYAPGVAAYVRGSLGPCADVEDLVQRVFLELLRGLGRFRGEAALSTWLHRIATHTIRKHRRSWWRRRRKEEAVAAEVDATGAGTRGADAEAVADARACLERVARALDGLGVEFRMTWMLLEIEGLSVAEAAAALGVRPGTVRTRHFRARQRILEDLERQAQASAAPRQEAPSRGRRLPERVEVIP